MRRSLLFLLAWAAPSAVAADASWPAYLGGPGSEQYSSLTEINKSNVKQLEVVWTYPTGEKGNYLFNPLVVDGTMYVLAKNNSIVALDAVTGEERWTHPNTGAVTQRGINYWESKDRSARRLFYLNAGYLTAIDARTGETIQSFGDNGRVDIRVGLDRDIDSFPPLQTNNPGRIFENLFIIPLPARGDNYAAVPADVHAYDTRTGKLAWVFHSVPHPGEFGYETWPKDFWKTGGGVHNWNELSVDEKRGIVYIPFGTARYDFYGANRHGQNLFGNSLVALDARTGKRLWHFQTVHHDLWDYDLPTAPRLLTVKHDGKTVEAVAQPTKQGFLFVFNRLNGEPLWPVEERPVPKSDVPGEETSPTQPFPTKPPPFARQSFVEKDINPYITEAEQTTMRQEFKMFRNEGLFTPPSRQGSVQMPGNSGGATWGSSAVEPNRGLMFVVSKERPAIIKLNLPGEKSRGQILGSPPLPGPLVTEHGEFPRYDAPYDFMVEGNGLTSIGPPWSQITAYDLNTGTIKWQIPDGGVTALAAQGHGETGALAPRGGIVATASGLLFIATASDRKFRAYDQDTGRILWEKDLPAGAEGVPAVYEIGGREYIALCAAAGESNPPVHVDTGKPPAAPGPGSYIVFALPRK
ncbi:MAG TPA: pyrroloquinoline quinone-dependent dehydrogenase [Bryobacteraceae bacterium]|nr:pyrroloquinoline quinone-dependent dehydrogenase [Bryobacteraceae bacterium]